MLCRVMAGMESDEMSEQQGSPSGGAAASSEELMTSVEAAQFLGISPRTLQRLLEQEALKGSRVGRQWRFRKEDLAAYLRRDPVAVPEPPAEDIDTGIRAVGDDESDGLTITTFSGVESGTDEEERI